jgi:hypothetical protein
LATSGNQEGYQLVDGSLFAAKFGNERTAENPGLLLKGILILINWNTPYPWSKTGRRFLFPKIVFLQTEVISRELASADVIASLTSRCRV